MLCFLHGFNEDEKTSGEPKTFRFRLLRKSRASLKLLSTSSPAMTAQSQPTTPPSPNKPQKEEKMPTTSKSRQKKFNRHFPSVDEDEKVLNYYSCALIGDILLQGYLYITKNYFAFYSNVFGYVTKLLIPMNTVEKISKEKTARIIPNAVGISTADERHVFGSLMSRENTYKFMTKVWEMSRKELEKSELEVVALTPETLVDPAASESDSSETKDEDIDDKEESTATNSQNTHSRIIVNESNKEENQLNGDIPPVVIEERRDSLKTSVTQGCRSFLDLPTQTLILCAATFLLILLFFSATFLLYRISRMHHKYVSMFEDHDISSLNEEVLSNFLKFSIHLHLKSASSMHNFVDTKLREVSKVRRDLEVLSTLLLPKDAKEQ